MVMQLEKKYYTVQDSDTLKLMYQHIKDSEVLAVDTETNGLNPRTGRIVGWSVSGEEGVGFYLPTLVWNFEKEELEVQKINDISCETISINLLSVLKGKKLVFHNASFDVQFIKNYFGIDLLEDIWIDTGLLVHTVNEEGADLRFGSPFALKSIAKQHQDELGLDVEKAANQEQVELKESIKKNGGSVTKESYEIYKADLDILSKYASADTDLTLRICNLYLGKLRDEGLERFFFEEEVMPIYREVTVPMEMYGVDLDIELLEKTYNEISEDLIRNKEIVINSLLEIQATNKWLVDTALSEFKPSNKGTWAQELIERYSLPLPKSDKTGKYSITQKTIEELEDSNIKKFLSSGDLKLLDREEVIRISKKLWKETNDGDYINIQSKKQLGEIVFKYMGIKPKVSGANTKSGRDKFDMEMVEELSKDYPWAENLRIYNKLLKIKSTYIERFKDGAENGKYYFYFKQNGTVSGRYGSDAQQLPKPLEPGQDVDILMKYTNIVRAFLIAGEGRKVIDADYESLEPHCFASVSGDEKLQDIFANNYDFYSYVAIQTEKLEGVSADKKADNYLKKLDPVKRNKAKAYSLGVAYGMDYFALSMTLGVDQQTAKDLIKGYLDGFPGLKKWRENSRNQVRKYGHITNFVGRVRHLKKVPDAISKWGLDKFGECNIMNWKFRQDYVEPTFIREAHDEIFPLISNSDDRLDFDLYDQHFGVPDTLKKYRAEIDKKLKAVKDDAQKEQVLEIKKALELPSNKIEIYKDAYEAELRKESRNKTIKVYRDYRNGLNNCLNFQLQSLAAAVVNRAALQINRKAKEMGIDAQVQAQVHDQLIINVREDQAEMFAPVVQNIMEVTTQLPGITLKAPPEIAKNWRDGH
jgi:DNA polymerase I-like protein with 3'-5' exonuclease and polymerase domains